MDAETFNWKYQASSPTMWPDFHILRVPSVISEPICLPTSICWDACVFAGIIRLLSGNPAVCCVWEWLKTAYLLRSKWKPDRSAAELSEQHDSLMSNDTKDVFWFNRVRILRIAPFNPGGASWGNNQGPEQNVTVL